MAQWYTRGRVQCAWGMKSHKYVYVISKGSLCQSSKHRR